MPEFDIAQFKRTLTAATAPRRDASTVLREAGIAEGKQRLKHRQAVGHVLKPFLTKAGLDVDTLDKVLAQNQSELRSHFQQQKAAVAKHSSAERDAFRHAVELGYEATQHLANRPRPADVGFGGLSSVVTLTTPFLIWEWPHPSPDQLRDYNIQALNSYAKILVDIPVNSFDNDSGSDSREFSFFFYWPNETGYLAIVQVFSVLSLNGACELAANAGVFSGDKMELWLDAWLYPIQYWLPVPPGGDLRNLRLQGDPLQHQQALNDLTAEGGHIFGGAGYAHATFPATPYGLSYGSYGGVTIPANATAVFEVTLTVKYQWSGNTLPDEIKADFADNNLHYYVGCPLVVLQFLTAPPVMA
jgi:hypothetical protein